MSGCSGKGSKREDQLGGALSHRNRNLGEHFVIQAAYRYGLLSSKGNKGNQKILFYLIHLNTVER